MKILIILGALLILGCGSTVQTSQNQIALDRPVASHYVESTPVGYAAALSAPEPTQAPTAAPVASNPAPAKPTYRNVIIARGIFLRVAGTYGDCSGNSPVGYAGGYLWPCTPADYFFLAHYSLFSGLLGLRVGDEITYWDGNGTAHVWHVIGIRDVPHGQFPGANGTAGFQTCLYNTNDSPVRVVDAN